MALVLLRKLNDDAVDDWNGAKKSDDGDDCLSGGDGHWDGKDAVWMILSSEDVLLIVLTQERILVLFFFLFENF